MEQVFFIADFHLGDLMAYRGETGENLLSVHKQPELQRKHQDHIGKAGITYLVTKLDSVTRTESKVPINEMASSHMARRTFIGNIYKLVKDPNLVSALTGHAEGSRAFNATSTSI